jgi:hypothetical protein
MLLASYVRGIQVVARALPGYTATFRIKIKKDKYIPSYISRG